MNLPFKLALMFAAVSFVSYVLAVGFRNTGEYSMSSDAQVVGFFSGLIAIISAVVGVWCL